MKSIIEKHKNGTIATAAYHIIIALLFIIFGFTTPPEEFPPPGEGILIDFGDSDQGLGDIEPENTNAEVKPDNETSDAEEEIMTQDFQDAAAMENTKDEVREEVEEDVEDNEEEETPVVNERALFPGNKNNNSDSEGEAGGDGNQGRPDGADTDNYNGYGFGDDGISFNLSGRKFRGKFPKPEYPKGNVYGKVVLNIKVDKYGNVISVSLGKGCTTDNEALILAAKKAAYKAKFNINLNTIEQVGTITYNFVLQ